MELQHPVGTFTFIPAPTITSFTPTTGPTGTVVSITGTNFTGATSVSFGGTAASTFTVVSATSINATVAAGTTGVVTVITPGGTGTSAGTFTFIPAPTITSFTPITGPTGTVVSITGTNFTGATSVSLEEQWLQHSLLFRLQVLMQPLLQERLEVVTVITPGGTGTSAGTFTFIPAPTITSFTPTTGPIGTVVTITGTNFTGATSVSFWRNSSIDIHCCFGYKY